MPKTIQKNFRMVTKTGPINNNIIVNPKIRFGKPCIRGTRIAVTDILNLLKAGYTIKEIPTQYPGITTADVRAALRYAAQVLGKEEILTIE